MTYDQLAEVGYEANRTYSGAIGESNPPWCAADECDRNLWRVAARYVVTCPQCDDEELHKVFLGLERQLGWSYGPVLDNNAKRHPHHVAWDQLPKPQQRKVSTFRVLVGAMIR